MSSIISVMPAMKVYEEANTTFATLLDRAGHSDQLKRVMALLKRYEHIFQIPARIRQGTAAKNFDQALPSTSFDHAVSGS